jgi:serine protease AprX
MNLSPRLLTLTLGLVACLIGNAQPAAAERASKLDRFLRGAKREGAVHRVIIQTRDGRRSALKKALESHGDAVQAEFPSLNALTVSLHGEDLAVLEADSSILSISIDAEVRSLGDRRNARGAKKGAARTKGPAPVDLLRETLGVSIIPFTGSGINIAVVDSGIEPTKDLASSIAGFWDFTRGGIATRPDDKYGHGTHVAGLIASSGVESDKEFAGVAPGATLYGFRVLDEKGLGRVSDVVRALEFIVANKRSRSPAAFKIDIINLSLGHPIYEPAASDPLVRAVENAVRAGIVVITAAGNVGMNAEGEAGYAGITSPGNAPSAITVGAVDTRHTVNVSDDSVAPFSSRGPTWFDGLAKPDLVAPGVGLTSDTPRFSSLFSVYPELKSTSKSGKGNFGKLSGTSMAAAVTTGVASLVMQASRAANGDSPLLTPNALKAVLQYTAFPLKDPSGVGYDALTQGTGEINARGAVAMAQSINTDMPVGSPWLREQLPAATLLGGQLVAWSRALLWDDNIVWGTDALSFNSPQWDDNIVWGTALGEDDNIVWGTADVENIVWGTTLSWTTDLVWQNRLIGLMGDDDNIVWGTADGLSEENIVWGTFDGENIVWGTWDGDNIVWGTSDDDNIVWGTFVDEENIVWGTFRMLEDDNIVWGTAARVIR